MRGRGEGSIYQRASDGRWVGSVTIGTVDGKRARRTVYGSTRKEVARALTALLAERDAGQLKAADKQTVAEYLAWWLEHVAQPAVRPNSLRIYRNAIARHIVPHIGGRRLDKLEPGHVQAMLTAIQAGYSVTTAAIALRVLRNALARAVRWERLPRNPATLVDSPRGQPAKRPILSVEQARALLAAASGQRIEALLAVTITLGLRMGEGLGLRWVDVDYQAGRLHIRQQVRCVRGQVELLPLKTTGSARTVPLPEVCAAALRAHQDRQCMARRVVGDRWQDYGLVFTNARGLPVDDGQVGKEWRRLLAATGVPPLRWHDLRHSCASLLAAQGVHPRVVMELLGHTTLSMTMDTYTHGTEELHRAAVRGLGDTLAG